MPRSVKYRIAVLSCASMMGLLKHWARFCGYLVFTVACSEDDNPNRNGEGGSSGTNSGAQAGTAGDGLGGSPGSLPVAGRDSDLMDGGAGVPAFDADSGVDAADVNVFTISSIAFSSNAECAPSTAVNCDLFPPENTGLGGAADVSPEIHWTGAPLGTQSFAIGLHDLSNLDEQDPFTHWVMWNIPGSLSSLPAELPRGSSPGVPAPETRQIAFRNDDGYAGSGACGNVYEFVLYALSTPSFDPMNEDSPDSVQAALSSAPALLATATMRARSDPDGPGCD